jgi:hypothetical protein
MPLDKQNVPVVFNQGIDTKSDPKQLQIGALVNLENAVLLTTNEFNKSPGYSALGSGIETGGSITEGRALMTFLEELVRVDTSTLYSYSEATLKNTVKGNLVGLDLNVAPVVRNTYEQTTPDSAYHSSGIKVFTWEDSSGGCRYAVYDAITGQSIVQDELISATGSLPKPIALGAYVVISYLEASSNSLFYRAITATTPSAIGSATLITNAVSTTIQVYDACKLGTNLCFTWNDNASTISMVLLSSTLVLGSPVSVASGVGRVLSCFADATLSEIWVGYWDGTNVRYFVRDSTLASVLVPTTIEAVTLIRNICGYADNGSGTLYYEQSATLTYNHLVREVTANRTGVFGSPFVMLRSVGLAGKPFVVNGVQYVVVTFETPLQPTYFVVNSAGQVIAKVAPSQGGGLTTKSILPETVFLDADSVQWAYLVKDFLISVDGDIVTQTGAQVATFDFNSLTSYQRASTAKNLHITGGFLSMYDGNTVVEHSFHLYPEPITLENRVAFGGLLGAGQYQYCAVYEWTDNQGLIHRSAPSPVLTVQTPTGGTLTADAVGFPVVGPLTTLDDVSFLAIGMGVTGPGISGVGTLVSFTTTGISTVLVISGFVGPAGGVFNFFQSAPFTVTTTAGSTTAIAGLTDPANLLGTGIYLPGTATAGSNVVNIPITRGLRVGMTLNNGPVDAKITAINGSNVTMNQTYPSNFTGMFSVLVRADTVTAAGSTLTFSVADAPLLNVIGYQASGRGSAIASTTRTTDALNKVTRVLTMSGSTAPFGVGQVWFNASQLLPFAVGQVIFGTNITAGTTIVSINEADVTNYSFSPNITYPQRRFVLSEAAVGTGTAAAGSSATYAVTVKVPTLRITAKQDSRSPVVIALYRTAVNQSTFYRVSSITAPTYNSTTTDSVSFVDSVPDETLIGNELLYTTGAVTENFAAPSLAFITNYKNRLMGVPSESRLNFWYTKEVGDNTPAEWTDTFVGSVDPRGGALTAIAEMDEKLILFKATQIYYMVGNGPDATGAQNDFSQPQRINVDAGCKNARSVVVIPMGLMFQSDKGIYIIDRSLAVQYIGDDVESYNNQTITSAILLESTNQVKFTLESGIALLYDYYAKQWDIETIVDAKDAVMFQKKYTYIQEDGVVNQNTPATYLDGAGDFYAMKIKTGWMSFANIQGYQRVYRMLIVGEYKSPHDLIVEVAYDFDQTIVQTVTITPDPAQDYQFRVDMQIQKCEAIQFTIRDANGDGQSMSLSAISFIAGMKRGLNKIPATRSYG